MATRHMTDDQIQAYLETGASALDQVFHTHLNECADCRRRVNEFRRLYHTLSEERGFDLSAGFSESVMVRVAAAEADAKRRRWWNLLLIALGMLVAVGAAAYFMNWEPLVQSIVSVFQPSVERSAEVLGRTDGVIGETSKGTILIIVFSVVVLAIVAGADHLLFRSRQTRYCL